MTSNKKQEQKKPDDKVTTHSADHLVIRDKTTGKKIISQRG